MPEFAVIIPAAGNSTRFGAAASKLFQPLGAQPVLVWTLRAFAGRGDVRQIVIATHDPGAVADCIAAIDESVRWKIQVCPGGTCRATSVRAAAETSSPEILWLAVHDAARPLVSQELIDRTVAAAVEHGAAAAAMPVHLTIKETFGPEILGKEASGPLPAQVKRTVPRDRLAAMQTPQIMRRADLLAAFASCPIPLAEVTDDVQLLELAGKPVWLVNGEERNLKITTPIDLKIAEMILNSQ
jgi:2-C-methyl-D-erythritol 4-phosphate cytidylyltransferase